MSYGQIKPPQQTDTIYIAAVKYNYADIRQENWPCNVIYKSTTSFKIGEDEFTILKASKSGLDVDFVVTDKEGKERYILTYIEGKKDITVKFSGYEFICRKILNEAPGLVSYSEESPFTAHAILTGRSINGALPLSLEKRGLKRYFLTFPKAKQSKLCGRQFFPLQERTVKTPYALGRNTTQTFALVRNISTALA